MFKKLINKILNFFKSLGVYSTGIIFFFTVIGIFVAWFFFGVSPFQRWIKGAVHPSTERPKFDQRKSTDSLLKFHLKTGYSLLNKGRYIAAKTEFKKALECETHNTDAQIGLLKTDLYDTMQKKDSIPEVIEVKIKSIIEVKPGDPHALSLLGYLYAKIGDIDNAKKRYEQAIKSDSDIASAWFGLGILYEKEGELDEAIKKYNEALKLSNLNERFLNKLAGLYRKQGDYANAIDKYNDLMALDFNYMLPYLGISLTYRLNRKLEMAAAYLQKLQELMDNIEICELNKNKEPWIFNTDRETISLYDLGDKKNYILYCFSITFFLLGKESDAEQYLKQAHAIETKYKDIILKLAEWDLHILSNKHPSYKERAKIFKRRYLL